jgi:hypothetical protein
MTLFQTGEWVVWDRPWLLAAGALAAAPVLLAIWARRRGGYIGGWNVAMQCAAVLLAAAALAGPAAPLGEARKPYLVFTDVSDSTRGQRHPLPLPPSLERQSYVFARNVAEGKSGTDTDSADGIGLSPRFSTDGTELSPVLQLSLARAGEIAGVILHTDGRFQDADWPQWAAQLAAKHVPVIIVPMVSPPADARISELSVTRGRGGRSADIRVGVDSNARQRRTVRLWREDQAGKPLIDRVLDLLPDQPATIHVDDAVPADRTVVYRAELSPPDEFPENDQARQVSPAAQRRVAIISRGGATWKLPLDSPLAQGARPLAPADAPRRAEGYLDYSAVMLDDPTGVLLDLAQREALARYVRQGGGLVMLGAGPRGSPADRKDPLNQAAALVPDPFSRRPLKVIVLLDASGSMAEVIPSGPAAGQIKFAIVSGAVLSLQEHLTPRDALSVITFSDTPQQIYTSGDKPPDFDALGGALAKVRPSGPTQVLPAIDQAIANSGPSGAGLSGRDGLVLLLSDLRTEKIADVPALAARLAKAHLALAVAASPDAERADQPYPLETLAARMKAPVVRSESFLDLADVFARLLRQARPEAIRRGAFAAEAVGASWLPRGPMPEVNAYILCAAAEGADVLGTVKAPGSKESDALIARRSVGLGRTVSLAIPLAPGENSSWDSWPPLGRLLGGAVDWAAAPLGDARVSAELAREGQLLTINLQARDAPGPMNLLNLAATVQPGDAAAKTISFPLSQTAPGLYQAQAPVPPGPLAVVVRDAAGRTLWQGALAETCGPELAAIGPDQAALQRLADLAGGRIVASPQLVDFIGARWASQRRPLWPFLLAGALALMLLDWVSVKLRRDL